MQALQSVINEYLSQADGQCSQIFQELTTAISQGRIYDFGVTEWAGGGGLGASYNRETGAYAFSRGFFGEPTTNGIDYSEFLLARAAIHEAVTR